MLKIGLAMVMLLLTSGCATIFGDVPEQPQVQDTSSFEQSRNERLKMKASALREAVRQQQDELQRLETGSQ